MDTQRYAIIVMSLVLAIGGTAILGVIAVGPGAGQTSPDDVPTPTRPRPAPKKKAEPKVEPKVEPKPPQGDTNTPTLDVAPPPRMVKLKV